MIRYAITTDPSSNFRITRSAINVSVSLLTDRSRYDRPGSAATPRFVGRDDRDVACVSAIRTAPESIGVLRHICTHCPAMSSGQNFGTLLVAAVTSSIHTSPSGMKYP